LPPTDYPACDIPGVTTAQCVPKEFIEDETEFCFDDNYPFVCIPVDHFLWPLWNIRQKDFKIQEEVALMTEQRLMLELARPFGDESVPVSGLELTSSVECLQGYK
jgi:hypothetical protein